jgi:hypothetical protein
MYLIISRESIVMRIVTIVSSWDVWICNPIVPVMNVVLWIVDSFFLHFKLGKLPFASRGKDAVHILLRCNEDKDPASVV